MPRDTGNRNGKKTALKQASLFRLSGVVVLEEIARQNAALRDPDVADAEKARILRALAAKRPSTEIIASAGIGRTVRRLAGTSDEAGRVFRLWKAEVERREAARERGSVDVLCDLEPRRWRGRAKRLFEEAGADGRTAERIEKELFDRGGHLTNGAYRRGVRKCTFALKRGNDNEEAASDAKRFVARHA